MWKLIRRRVWEKYKKEIGSWIGCKSNLGSLWIILKNRNIKKKSKTLGKANLWNTKRMGLIVPAKKEELPPEIKTINKFWQHPETAIINTSIPDS